MAMTCGWSLTLSQGLIAGRAADSVCSLSPTGERERTDIDDPSVYLLRPDRAHPHRRHQLDAGGTLVQRHHALDDAVACGLREPGGGQGGEFLHHGPGVELAARKAERVGHLDQRVAS